MFDEIDKYLLDNTFRKLDNVYDKHKQVVGGYISINGQKMAQTKDTLIEIEYIGDGWIGESEEVCEPLTQWTIRVDSVPNDEFLVYNLEEFKQLFGKYVEQ